MCGRHVSWGDHVFSCRGRKRFYLEEIPSCVEHERIRLAALLMLCLQFETNLFCQEALVVLQG